MAKRVPVPKSKPDETERFWRKVEKTPTCWLWRGGTFSQGYGCFVLRNRARRAHRVLYVWTHGELPRDKELDHACNNRLCVRPHPDHVRPLSQVENVRRANQNSPAVINAAKTHCKRGHAFTEINTRIYNGLRVCRECKRLESNERYRASNPGAKVRGPYKTSRSKMENQA